MENILYNIFITASIGIPLTILAESTSKAPMLKIKKK
jgi:hypothetical protein